MVRIETTLPRSFRVSQGLSDPKGFWPGYEPLPARDHLEAPSVCDSNRELMALPSRT